MSCYGYRQTRSLLVLAALIVPFPEVSSAQVDAFAGHLATATQQFERGEYRETLRALSAAAAEVHKQQLQLLKRALPQPLPGWHATVPEAEYIAATVLRDSGMNAKRSYANGEQHVDVIFLTGEPVVRFRQMSIDHPLLLSWAGAAEVQTTTIRGQSAVTKWQSAERSGEVAIIVENTMLVLVTGRQIASIDLLLRYADNVDFDFLKKLLTP